MSRKKSKRDTEKDKVVRHWYERGFSTGQIAEYLGVTRQAVHFRLRELGVAISMQRKAWSIAEEIEKKKSR